tara:strand:+ start:1974 stop:3692 length:1719 start_codon:yes stop_codon:yes gene_type:complete
MAYLDGQTQREYYEGREYGQYQFVSLQDVISQFMVAYVGDNKLITSVDRTDVAFFAQRGLAELSFDTLKSFKSQSIILPPTLVMPLPHDYVNYTRVVWCDESGIKRPLYRTTDTQNPFQIKQTWGGGYDFQPNNSAITFNDFTALNGVTEFSQYWQKTPNDSGSQVINPNTGLTNQIGGGVVHPNPWFSLSEQIEEAEGTYGNGEMNLWTGAITEIANDQLIFRIHQTSSYGTIHGSCLAVWQEIDASNIDLLVLRAKAVTDAAGTMNVTLVSDNPNTVLNEATEYNKTYNSPASTVRIGLTTKVPDTNTKMFSYLPSLVNPEFAQYDQPATTNTETDLFDIGYLEWTGGVDNNVEKTLELPTNVFDGPVYFVMLGFAQWEDGIGGSAQSELYVQPRVSSVSLENFYPADTLEEATGYYQSSIMWEKYKDIESAEIQNQDYKDPDYQRSFLDERYGLDPSRAQTNGSFYIDDRIGRIHFSSNVSGKTVILDYISDSLGTEDEMQVHKFAEEALYKYIAYNILSTRSNIPEVIVRRLKKEKFAMTRQAKHRLSNVKLEDITRVLRGKSKHIKH